MKASELQPGQFFEFIDLRERYKAVDGKHCFNSESRLYFINKHDVVSWCANDLSVKLLAVTGWDDEPKQLVDDWQPIETAPQDGSRILLRSNCRDGEGSWGICKTQSDGYVANDKQPCWRHADCVHLFPGRITHWKPIAPTVAKPAIADAIESAAAAFHQKLKEPDQFAAGDWVVADSGASQSRYGITPKQLVEASKWCLYVEENFPYHPSHFRRATPAEIAKATEPKPTEQFAAGDWLYCIESHAGIVKGSVYQVLEVDRHGWPEVEEDCGYWNPKYFRRATADEIENKPDNRITHYRLVNPPTPVNEYSLVYWWVQWVTPPTLDEYINGVKQ